MGRKKGREGGTYAADVAGIAGVPAVVGGGFVDNALVAAGVDSARHGDLDDGEDEERFEDPGKHGEG